MKPLEHSVDEIKRNRWGAYTASPHLLQNILCEQSGALLALLQSKGIAR